MELAQRDNKYILWREASIIDIQRLFFAGNEAVVRIYIPQGTKVIHFSLKNKEKYKSEVNDMFGQEVFD